MDNLSHSLVGLALGELVQRSLAPEPDAARQQTRRRMLLLSGWAASNFPDLDLVFTPLLPSPLGYLLHHRGHTHTLLALLPQALLLLAMIWVLWPGARRLLRASASARAGLAMAAGLGFVFHLLLDYLNSYGVHPFHPFDSGWLYGDMVFILEPVFWVAFTVPLALMLPRRWMSALVLIGLAGALLFFAARGLLHGASLAALAVLAIAMALLQKLAGSGGRHALAGALVASIAFVALQGAASAHGKRVLAAELQRLDPASRLLDISMTAYPANPACWIFVSVERNDTAGMYRLRRGMLSVAPWLLPWQACPPGFSEAPSGGVGNAFMVQTWQQETSLAELRTRHGASCHFAAWLRFVRAPALGPAIASDARFGTNAAGNLAALPYARFDGQPCPDRVPGWDMPRRDLLERRQLRGEQ